METFYQLVDNIKFKVAISIEQPTSDIGRSTIGMRGVMGVAVTPDGNLALSASLDNKIQVWDLKTGKIVRTFKDLSGDVTGIAVTPDGCFVLTTSRSNLLEIWNISGQKIGSETYTGQPRGLAITPDGRHALIAHHYQVSMIDIKTQESVWVFKNFSDPWGSGLVYAVAITSNMQYAVAAYDDSNLRVWDINQRREIHLLKGHEDYVKTVAVTPNNQFAISGSEDHSLKIWSMETGEEISTLTGHLGLVQGVATFSDNQHIVSASNDGTVKVWDLFSRSQIATFSADASMYCCAISPNDNIIVAGDADGNVHLLDWKITK